MGTRLQQGGNSTIAAPARALLASCSCTHSSSKAFCMLTLYIFVCARSRMVCLCACAVSVVGGNMWRPSQVGTLLNFGCVHVKYMFLIASLKLAPSRRKRTPLNSRPVRGSAWPWRYTLALASYGARHAQQCRRALVGEPLRIVPIMG